MLVPFIFIYISSSLFELHHLNNKRFPLSCLLVFITERASEEILKYFNVISTNHLPPISVKQKCIQGYSH